MSGPILGGLGGEFHEATTGVLVLTRRCVLCYGPRFSPAPGPQRCQGQLGRSPPDASAQHSFTRGSHQQTAQAAVRQAIPRALHDQRRAAARSDGLPLTASLPDHSLPRHRRYYSDFESLIIDEFGFDERACAGGCGNRRGRRRRWRCKRSWRRRCLTCSIGRGRGKERHQRRGQEPLVRLCAGRRRHGDWKHVGGSSSGPAASPTAAIGRAVGQNNTAVME